MKIKLTRNTVVDGSVYMVGDVVETSDQVGKYLIKIGKAEAVEEPKAAKGKAEKATVKPPEKAVDPKTED